MSDLVSCPHCQGRKGGMCFYDGVDSRGRRKGWTAWRDCQTCQGDGEVDAATAERIIRQQQAGEALRADRLARGLSVRQEAERLGIHPIELNAREHGREWKPEASS